MAGTARYRIVSSYVGNYQDHWNYAIEYRTIIGRWVAVDTGGDIDKAPGRLRSLAGNPNVVGWYDKDGCKTSKPLPSTVPLKDAWLAVLATFLGTALVGALGVIVAARLVWHLW